jgi:hypothetical protein
MLKRFYLLTFFVLILTSCTKTSKDIQVDQIKTSCEWMEAYEVVITEYSVYVNKKLKELKKGVTDPEKFRIDFDLKRKYYEDLFDDIIQQSENLSDRKSADFSKCNNKISKSELDSILKNIHYNLLPQISVSWVAESYLKAIKNHDWAKRKGLQPLLISKI